MQYELPYPRASAATGMDSYSKSSKSGKDVGLAHMKRLCRRANPAPRLVQPHSTNKRSFISHPLLEAFWNVEASAEARD